MRVVIEQMDELMLALDGLIRNAPECQREVMELMLVHVRNDRWDLACLMVGEEMG